jgi:hypothetical protein
VDRIEGDFLVLQVEDGQELFWPQKKGASFKEGDELFLFLNKEDGQNNNEEEAKKLLRQIFKKDV